MPPSTQPQTPATPEPTPITPPPIPPAPVAPPPPPPVPPLNPPVVPPPPVSMPMPPKADVVMPRVAPSVEHHSHTAALVTGGLIIGLIIGAAGGYYGAQLQTKMLGMLGNAVTDQNAQQATPEEQAEISATADSYGEVDTNPLTDVKTNPFE